MTTDQFSYLLAGAAAGGILVLCLVVGSAIATYFRMLEKE